MRCIYSASFSATGGGAHVDPRLCLSSLLLLLLPGGGERERKC